MIPQIKVILLGILLYYIMSVEPYILLNFVFSIRPTGNLANSRSAETIACC